MEDLIIKPTNKSLSVKLTEGNLVFSGCSIINDPRTFFSPILKWVENYGKNPSDETHVDIKFEYIDSASVKSFFEILKELNDATRKKKLNISWHYDLDDPEILELGEIIESKLNLQFNFVEYIEEEEEQG
ncbi:MAG: DUF1987 domain-containing protein [Bacteroidota bacterium]